MAELRRAAAGGLLPQKLSSAERFERFAGQFCGLRLEPFQRHTAREVFAERRELVVLLPRGNGETTLFAAVAVLAAVHARSRHLRLRRQPRPGPAAVRNGQADGQGTPRPRSADHPALLGAARQGGFLRVLASDAPLAHGLTPSLVLVDELHAHRDGELYTAMRTSMLKRPGARMVTISTAGSDVDGPLGRLRTRALGFPP